MIFDVSIEHQITASLVSYAAAFVVLIMVVLR